MLRRIWRLFRMLMTFVVRTARISLAVRRMPASQRPLFRARGQMIGTAVLCRILGARVTMRGTPPERPMLYVCNHLGLLDTLVLAAQMPVAFAAKAEVRRWPLLGWVCTTVGVLFVERERPTQAGHFVRQVQQKLREGISVVVFPEGTTGPGDAVLPFKTGAFEAVAGQADGAVLPLSLSVLDVEGDPSRRQEAVWTGQSFVKHAWHLMGLKSVRLHINVGAPIATAGRDRKVLARLTHRSVSELAAHVLTEAA